MLPVNLLRDVSSWGPDRRLPPSRWEIYEKLFREGRFIYDCQGPCECLCLVEWRSARTSFNWDGEGEDPNHPILLCDECAEEHAEYWDEMWANYRSDRM